jgi:hypothetical protein
MAAVAGSAFVDGAARQVGLWIFGALPAGFPIRPAQAVLTLVIAGLIAGALPVHVQTRAWALALTPLMAWMTARAADVILGRVILPLI